MGLAAALRVDQVGAPVAGRGEGGERLGEVGERRASASCVYVGSHCIGGDDGVAASGQVACLQMAAVGEISALPSERAREEAMGGE